MSDTPARWPHPHVAANSLLPPGWRELQALVDTVLDTPPERREAVLSEMSAGDPERRAALERLVAECECDAPLLDRPAAERFARLLDEEPGFPLPETLGGRYRIDREVGRGGMALVHLARDLKHSRDVAVKVIRPDLAASLGRERFLAEIGIAARLHHPNIVPLYDSGDADGVLYFVMPFEEGPSLRTRLGAGGPLPVPECVSILRDVARALAYAHEQGVVHRDVKPDNVMMSGGAAVVTDFGIAKAVSVAQSDALSAASPSAQVRLSSAIGTPAYMSPEQGAGDPSTDHRADIYSFGCLAFELLTGKAPFHDQPTHLVADAHASTVPPPVTTLRADVPPDIAELVAQCLAKDPAARPQSANDVLSALDRATTTDPRGPSPAHAAPPMSRAFTWAPRAMVAAMIATAAYVASKVLGASAPVTLAVLPFSSISADSAVRSLAEGLADEVSRALSRVPGIQVKSRTGALAYRGQVNVDATQAGAKLKVAYLLTGAARLERGRWVLSADLTRTADATSTWGESFPLDPNEQTGTADAIAASLSAALRSRFPKSIGAAPPRTANQQTSNNDAYFYTALGHLKLNQRSQGVAVAADLFRKAIDLDSMYASAHSGLSMALAFYPHHQGSAVKEIHGELVRAARRALQLDSTLAEPHIALGMAHGFAYQWDSSAAELRAAIQLDRHDVEARLQYGRLLRNRGQLDEALTQLRAARAEDATSAAVLSHLSYVYYLDHQLDSALAESVRALETDPLNRTSVVMGAFVRLAMNRPGEARKLIERAPETSPFIAYVIAKSGDTATARRRLREQDAESPQPGLGETRRAYTYLGLGDTAKALSALERAIDAGEIWGVLESYIDPINDPIRQSARFKALLRRVRLVP